MVVNAPEHTLAVESGTGITVEEELAGAGSRSYAYILDWHVRVGLVLLWYLGYMGFLGTMDLLEVGSGADTTTLLWMNAPPLLLYMLYHPVLELWMAGNSPGKRWAGVRIVDESGAPPGPAAILIRNVFRLIDSLPFFYTVGLITVMLSRQYVRLGDMVAGTVMVKSGANLTRDLAKVAKIEAAAIDPQTAELVIELLDRWREISRKQRTRLALALLDRCGVEIEKTSQKAIRAALQSLLKPA